MTRNMFPLWELVEDVRQQILGYLCVSESGSLTLTCRRARRDVEAFSERELLRIRNEHNVDDTWLDRVGLQAGEGEDIVPIEHCSFWRSLRNAYLTHLYNIDVPLPVTRFLHPHDTLSHCMHPDGTRLLTVVVTRDPRCSTVRLWDLETKKCDWIVTDERLYDGLHVGVSRDRIVLLWSQGIVRILSMNGDVVHDKLELDSESTSPYFLAIANDFVYIMDGRNSIYVINTATWALRSIEQPWEDAPGFDDVVTISLCVCNNNLIRLGNNGSGFHVIDTDSWSVQSHHYGHYDEISVTPNGEVALARLGQIQLLQLRHDGSLGYRRSFFHELGETFPCLYRTRSKIFVKEGTGVVVYNAFNGEMERRLPCPTENPVARVRVDDMFSNAKELFVCFSIYQDEIDQDGVQDVVRTGCGIKAFLL